MILGLDGRTGGWCWGRKLRNLELCNVRARVQRATGAAREQGPRTSVRMDAPDAISSGARRRWRTGGAHGQREWQRATGATGKGSGLVAITRRSGAKEATREIGRAAAAASRETKRTTVTKRVLTSRSAHGLHWTAAPRCCVGA